MKKPARNQLTVTGTSGNDNLVGTADNDLLEGLDGNDVLDGRAGIDTTDGGAGDDWHYVDNAADVVREAIGGGADRVFASVSYTLPAGAEVEIMSTDFHAGFERINLTGNELANTIYGNEGFNQLNGGAGADTLIGRNGSDSYFVDNAGDRVFEAAGEGFTDRVFASVSYTLMAGAEVDIMSTDFNAGTAPIDLTGNEFRNIIYGNDGDNRLDGVDGPFGSDTLVGRAGNDWYFVVGGDRVVETAGGGSDRVFARDSYILTAGAEVEILSTDWHAGTAADNLFGNELANTIYGNDGDNFLWGEAGADTLIGLGGRDVLIGGHGDDTFFVDGRDGVNDDIGEGNDRLFASASFAISDQAEVELMTTDFHAGTAPIDLTGNMLANTIYGNDGDNRLDGGAGADTLVGRAGNDTLIGGAGDDACFVDNAGDRIFEATGQGNDRVYASGSYTLTAGAEVELMTTDFHAGTAAINLTGSDFANTIYGNAGSNVLDGWGGNDTLVGLAGADMFQFTTALGAGNVDRIIDFVAGTDKIGLDDAIFTAIGGLGALNANAFVAGSAAADANDRIIYNAATGQLFYDVDGSGGGAAIQFATLSVGLALGASDFQVI